MTGIEMDGRRIAKAVRTLEQRARPRLRRFGLATAAPPRLDARHAERSMLFSADDDVGPSARLVEVALAAAQAAHESSLESLDARLAGPPYWASLWPGEHYRLLAGLVRTLRPATVIEVGTATGLSALALTHDLAPQGRVVTFDIVPWQEYPGGVLCDADFEDGRLVQQIDDLSTPGGLERHRELLSQADLVFVDAAKDGHQEQRFLDNFAQITFAAPPIMVFDDIRLWNMLKIWRGIRRPKLDLTSFGHWSGTGLIDWR